MTSSSEDIKADLNAGHAHNLIDFLIIYGKLGKNDAINPKLEEVTLKSIKISYGSTSARKVSKIKFIREQKDYEQTKSLLFSMEKEASFKRGYSPYIVKKIPLPSKPIEFLYWAIFWIIVYASFTPEQSVALLVDYAHLSIPAAKQAVSSLKWILNLLFVAHSTETASTLNPIMFKYRVPMIQRMFASLLCLIEGRFFIKRFQKVCDAVDHKE